MMNKASTSSFVLFGGVPTSNFRLRQKAIKQNDISSSIYHFFSKFFVIITVCHPPCAMLIETIWKVSQGISNDRSHVPYIYITLS